MTRLSHERVLLTGASGYLGRNMVRVIRSAWPGSHLIGVARHRVEGLGCEQVTGDMADQEWVRALVKDLRPDVVLHFAAHVFGGDWRDYYVGNIQTEANLLEAVIEEGVECRVFLPGSAAEYGNAPPENLPITESCPFNPISPYGVSKAWQYELACYYTKVRGVDIVMGRIFNLVGRDMHEKLSVGYFERQLRAIRRGEQPAEVKVWAPESRRDFLDVDDACRAVLSIAEHGKTGEPYNICSGQSVSTGELLMLMAKRAGVAVSLVDDPRHAGRIGIPDSHGSYRKLDVLCGWKPAITLEESVGRIFADIPVK
jgi:GDP-4-dehydro-6-deoxy-D-mannose reductase